MPCAIGCEDQRRCELRKMVDVMARKKFDNLLGCVKRLLRAMLGLYGLSVATAHLK